MNENSPIVAFDRSLGEHVDYIDVDYDELVEYMQGRGFDDETIKNTKINISGETSVKKHKKSKTTTYTYGVYNKKTDEIDIYPRSDIDVRQPMYDYYSEHDDKDLGEMMIGETDRSLSGSVSRTVGHELEHKLIKYEGGVKAEKLYLAKVVGKRAMLAVGTYMFLNYGSHEIANLYGVDTSGTFSSLLMTGTSTLIGANTPKLVDKYMPGAIQRRHNEYKNAPEEKRCREVEESTPDIVTIKTALKIKKLA